MGLLLLEINTPDAQEIKNLFLNAGYQVKLRRPFDRIQNPSEQNDEKSKSVTILQIDLENYETNEITASPHCSLNPWRLSLRHHLLVAPNMEHVQLTTLEFSLVRLFALVEKGEVVSRKRIIEEFGEHYLSYDQNRLDTLVMRIRKKTVHHLGMRLPLNTVRVRGFSFDDAIVLDH